MAIAHMVYYSKANEHNLHFGPYRGGLLLLQLLGTNETILYYTNVTNEKLN